MSESPQRAEAIMPLTKSSVTKCRGKLGMANNGEWRTVQYLVEGVKVIKCFHPSMITPPMGRVNTN